MGMKPPRGQAQPIGNTVSSPKDVDCYEKIGNAATAPKPTGETAHNIGNSSMPEPEGTGAPKLY